MARRRGNDDTRKLRADRLAQYARQVDAAVVEGGPVSAPELRVAVGYEDDEQDHGRSTVAPPPPEVQDGEAVALDAVPVLLVAREEIAWLSVDPDAELLLAAIDGHSSAREIVASSKLAHARATLLLIQLEAAGIVRLA